MIKKSMRLLKYICIKNSIFIVTKDANANYIIVRYTSGYIKNPIAYTATITVHTARAKILSHSHYRLIEYPGIPLSRGENWHV